ncbi:unnamed protein product [Allacma fusca]|uniref:Uncharacterized protein n=1 Tax=Allacma fusca TaxID=39272 RepID=A0A8J2NSM6_9HEXA|nr:unnamed protein product [Allacma fusca]
MELANGLDVSIKLRGCRSCERSRMSAEVPPLGLEMFFATGKVSIEAAFAFEIESTDLGLVVAVKAGENKNKSIISIIASTGGSETLKSEKSLKILKS